MDILLNAVSSKQQELEDMQMAHSQVAEVLPISAHYPALAYVHI